MSEFVALVKEFLVQTIWPTSIGNWLFHAFIFTLIIFYLLLKLTFDKKLKRKNAIKLKDGTERKFIQDNDTVIMRGFANSNGVRIGFGEVANMVLPAKV